MNPRRCRALTALLAGGLSLFCGAAGPTPTAPSGTPPSLLLITIDTWRWDYLGASGSGKVRTPALDRLAREGVYEREAVTPCPLTTPAHASLFTGLNVNRHGVLDCTSYRLGEGPETLAEALRAGGLKTAAFVAGDTLRRRYGLDRGFDRYDDSGLGTRSRGDWLSAGRDGAAVTEAALAHLRAQGASEPLFIWTHYFDLHLPYRPRPGLDPLYPRDPYAAQAAYVDGQVGRLRTAIEADTGRSWRIVVVGDHGEGLGDRGEDTHGMGLYRSTLHVPLIIWPKPPKPLLHPRPWGLVDLLPTLRAWFGLPPGRGEDGASLFGPERKDRWLAAVTIEPAVMFGVAPLKGIRQGRYYCLMNGSTELYDLVSDPDMRSDLGRASAHRKNLRSLRSIADRVWPGDWPSGAGQTPPSLPEEDKRALQSLGYIAGRVPSGRPLVHAPIGKILRDRSLWDRAREEFFVTRKGDGLLALLARLVSDYPASPFLLREYGVRLAQAGDLQGAIRRTEESVRLDPQDASSLTNLGGLYLQDGRDGPAETILKKALALDPAGATVHKNLGILYAEYRKDPALASRHYREHLRLAPDSPDAPAIAAYLADHPDPQSEGMGQPAGPVRPR